MTGRSLAGCRDSRPEPESLCCCSVILREGWSRPSCSGKCLPFRSRRNRWTLWMAWLSYLCFLVKQLCDSDYKYSNIIFINQTINIHNLNNKITHQPINMWPPYGNKWSERRHRIIPSKAAYRYGIRYTLWCCSYAVEEKPFFKIFSCCIDDSGIID